MEHAGDSQPIPALRAASAPALVPAIGVLAGTCGAQHLSYLPLAAAVALIVLGLTVRRRDRWVVAALGLGLLNAAARPAGEPVAMPVRPVEVVAEVAGHPVRHDDSTFFPARVSSWRLGEEERPSGFDLRVTTPPDAPPPAIGSKVRLRGYLRRSPGYANEPATDPGPWRMRLKSARFLTVEKPPAGLTALAGWLRRRTEEAFEAAGEDSVGLKLARALLLGDRSRLPASWQAALRRCGLAHVLAVSGLHVGLLAVVLTLAASVLPPRLRYLPALLGIAAYLLLIGPRPAVLRASWMGLLALGALALHRPPQALNALACCAAGLVLADPSIAGRLGFQLSVAATAGILVLTPIYAARWTVLPVPLRRPLAAAVGAQLATLPWTLSLSGGVHPLAPVLNLVAVPLLAIFLVLSFLWLAAASVLGPMAAEPLVALLEIAVVPLELLARLPPHPAFFQPLVAAGWVAAGLVAAGIAAVALWSPVWAARVGLVALLAAQTDGVPRSPAEPAVEVVVFDVGQGDAVLLRDGDRSVLVDGGGWPHGDFGGRVLAPALAAMGIDRLDALVLSHPDHDHCGGLLDLSRYLPAAEIWAGPGWGDSPCAAELLAAPTRRWRVLWRGELEHVGRWRIEVLHPGPGARLGRNDRSLVLAAAFGEHRLLLTGDIEAAVEERLARHRPGALVAGILKVAHHGSKTSTRDVFLRAVAPRIALISAGVANPYGHPHPRVLERLAAARVWVLRTDRSGMLRLKLLAGGRISIGLQGSQRGVPAPR